MRKRSSQRPSAPKVSNSVKFQRAALWSTYYHRFFGPVRSANEIPTGLMPMSRSDSCQALLQALKESEMEDRPRPQMLQRCAANILHSDYRPRGPKYQEVFDKLISEAARVKSRGAAIHKLLQYGKQQFGPARLVLADAAHAVDEIAAAAPTELTVSEPTQIAYAGNVFTVTKRSLVRRPLHLVAPLINPENWEELAPLYFRMTCRVRRDGQTGKQSFYSKGDPTSAASWNGILYEHFVVTWNAALAQTFDVFLKIDFTNTRDMVRTDYSLLYEEQDQILTDDGFVEGQPVERHPGWTLYTVRKSLRFASSFMNQVAPAILSMYMETDHDVVEGAAKKIEFLLRQPKAKRAELARAMRP